MLDPENNNPENSALEPPNRWAAFSILELEEISEAYRQSKSAFKMAGMIYFEVGQELLRRHNNIPM